MNLEDEVRARLRGFVISLGFAKYPEAVEKVIDDYTEYIVEAVEKDKKSSQEKTKEPTYQDYAKGRPFTIKIW